jgi:hypothetical protein
MMGSNDKPQDELFYSFNLDDVVPEDHLLRQIDQFLDFSELREHLAPYYSHTVRPSIDPDAVDRVLPWHSLGATALHGSAAEPGVPLVLQAEHLGPGAGSFDVLEEPARPVP